MKEWLKDILEKQEEKKKTHYINIISDDVIKNIKECKKRKLCSYHVPLIFIGYPRYNVNELYNKLYKKLKKIEDDHYNIMIDNGQIVIYWKNHTKKTYPELVHMLNKIDELIYKTIERLDTSCIYEIPLQILGLPKFDYEKTVRRE